MKKQIGINMIANVISFLVSTGINFFLTPFLINSIGIGAYSFLPLSSNVISYFMIFATALNSMAARFITIEVHKKNDKTANEFYSSIVFSNLALSVIFSICFTLIVVFLTCFVKIPPKIVFDVKMLFALTFGSTIFTLMATVFASSTFCANRLDLDSLVKIITSGLRVFVLIALFSLFVPKLYYLGISSLLMAIVTLVANIIFTKKLMPNVRIRRKFFKLEHVKTLLSSGIWNSLQQTGQLMLSGFDILLANWFLTTTAAGQIGVSKTIPNLIFSIALLLVSAFVPQFTIHFAKNEADKLQKMVFSSIRVTTFLMAVPLAGFVVLGKEFYHLWLPNQNTDLIYILTILTMVPTFFSSYVAPLGNIFVITNKLKMPTYYTLAIGLINIMSVVVLLFVFPEYGIYIIAAISGILLIGDRLVFRPIYAAICLNLKKSTFYPQMIMSTLTTILIIILFVLIKWIFIINSWTMLVIVALICTILGYILNIFTMLSKGERYMILKRLKLMK